MQLWVEGGADAGRAETASIWAKVGRELRGTGGGASSAGLWRAPTLFSTAEFDLKVDGGGGSRRVGKTGACSSLFWTPGAFTGRDGSRGGRVGLGGSVAREDGIGLGGGAGDLLACAAASLSAVSFAFASSSRRVGRSGGNFASPSAGGSFLKDCPSPAADERLGVKDRLDTVE